MTKFVVGLVLLVVLVCGFNSMSVYAVSSRKIGGPCKYVSFSGKCKITSVGTSAITFRFTPKLTSLFSKDMLSLGVRETISYMTKSNVGIQSVSYLGLRCLMDEMGRVKTSITETDLKNCGLKTGVSLGCKMQIVTYGACSPIDYTFLD